MWAASDGKFFGSLDIYHKNVVKAISEVLPKKNFSVAKIFIINCSYAEKLAKSMVYDIRQEVDGLDVVKFGQRESFFEMHLE
jgi:hypothetical protein